MIYRSNARKYTVLVSDGHSTEPSYRLSQTAAAIRNAFKESVIYSIGVEGNVDLQELTTISGDPDKVMLINSFEQIGDIKGVSIRQHVISKKKKRLKCKSINAE